MLSHRAWIVLGLSLAASAANAQHPAFNAIPVSLPAPDSTLGDSLRSLASRAGTVFIGQVVSIERRGGVVEVHFAVQQAVQGTADATYTLREWAGLWPQGEQRYVPGQRSLIFLHPASSAGLSSPVDGMEGIVPLLPVGADATPLLDVRRLATRIRRNAGQPLAEGTLAVADAVAAIKGDTPSRLLPITSRPHGQAEQQ